ncbi:MAG TPA: TIGR02757 family protein [Labilithrix sp.]
MRRDADPVGFVHGYESREDREIVALVCASCAFGNVKAIRAKVAELLALVGPSPARAADDAVALRKRLAKWKHRVYRGDDVARLFAGARAVQREAGSLGDAFAEELARADRVHEAEVAWREAVAAFLDRIRDAGGLRKGHLVPDARAGSAVKRVMLFLRWMARPADGIDLGLWDVPTDRLLVPLDVHIHKLARNLGLTRRNDLSWRTAVEITRCLARLDAADPTRYDFSLCHMGMLQRCPSRRDPERCEGCGVKPVCVHWRRTT